MQSQLQYLRDRRVACIALSQEYHSTCTSALLLVVMLDYSHLMSQNLTTVTLAGEVTKRCTCNVYMNYAHLLIPKSKIVLE